MSSLLALLTWCNLKNNVAVGTLLGCLLLVIDLNVQGYAAVAALVSVGHIPENHPHVFIRIVHLHS